MSAFYVKNVPGWERALRIVAGSGAAAFALYSVAGPMGWLLAASAAGIAISAGSACHSGKLQPSPVLMAMGYEPLLAQSGLRITLGSETTKADIDWVAVALTQMMERLTASMTVQV